jgi:hypothetical protein
MLETSIPMEEVIAVTFSSIVASGASGVIVAASPTVRRYVLGFAITSSVSTGTLQVEWLDGTAIWRGVLTTSGPWFSRLFGVSKQGANNRLSLHNLAGSGQTFNGVIFYYDGALTP